MIEVVILKSVVIVKVKNPLTDEDLSTIKRLQGRYPGLEIRIIFDDAHLSNETNNNNDDPEPIEP